MEHKEPTYGDIVRLNTTCEASWKAYDGHPNQPEGWADYKPYTIKVTPSELSYRVKAGTYVIYAKSEFHARMYCHYGTERSQNQTNQLMGIQAQYSLVDTK
jgi:hypothetical protein